MSQRGTNARGDRASATPAPAAALWARPLAHIGANRAHDARGWARVDALPSQDFEHLAIVLRKRRYGVLRGQLHHSVAIGLELNKQLWQSKSGWVLEIMHQDDALSALLQLRHHRLQHLLGALHFEVERVKIGRKNANVSLAKVSR